MTERQSVSTEEAVVAPLKFKALIQRSEKDKSGEEAQYAADQAELKLNGDILETRKHISKCKQTLDTLKSSKDFDPKSILEAQEELKAYESGLQALQALKEELF